MNLRDLALISTATVFGGVASAMAIHFFFNPTRRKHFSPTDSTISKKIGSRCPFDRSKRQGYLTWDDYFMAIAFLSAERSKDPNRQVGACLVSEHGVILGKITKLNFHFQVFLMVSPKQSIRVIGELLPLRIKEDPCCSDRFGTSRSTSQGAVACIGYNGFPRGCSDDKLPWSKKSRTGNPLDTKYPYVCHAEVNAILNTNHASAAGQRLYVTMFPCNECAKIIIQSGVSEVIYFVEKRLNNSDTAYVASHKLLSMAGVKVRKHQPQMDRILIKFEEH